MPQASYRSHGRIHHFMMTPPHIYKTDAPTARRICVHRCRKTFSTASTKSAVLKVGAPRPVNADNRTSAVSAATSQKCHIRTWKGSWTDGHSPLVGEIHERNEGRCDHVLVDPQIQTFAVRRYVIGSAVSSRMER